MIALDSGTSVRVAEIGPLWLGEPYNVRATWLTAVGMAYFHGEVPQ